MKKILSFLIAGVIVSSLSSCLKDDTLISPEAPGAINNIIEFKNPDYIASPTDRINPVYVKSFDVAPEATGILQVNYAGSGVAPQDITVKVSLAPELITSYNAKTVADARAAAVAAGTDPDDAEADLEGTLYSAMPSNLYTVSTMDVVIPKGKRTADITYIVKPDQFNFAINYALAFKIESASSGVVSGNFGTVILAIGGKNQFDGTYTYKTSANTSLVPNANKTVTLITQSANSVKLSPGLLGTYSNEVIYTINTTTNAVTVTCPSLGVQEPQDARSKWDPASKTLTVFWKQGNGGRTFEETFIYKGSR